MKQNFTRTLSSLFLAIIFSSFLPANGQSNTSFDVEVTAAYNYISSTLPLSGNRVGMIINDENCVNTYLRIYNSSGVETSNVNINSQFDWPHTTHGGVDVHAIAMDNGNIFIAYNANTNSTGIQTYNARYLIIDESGVAQASGQLNTIDAGSSYTWRILLDKLSDGKIVALWNRSASDNITFRLFNADGTAAGSDVAITGPGSPSNFVNSYTYKLAAGKTGNFMVSVYYWNGNFRGFIYNNNGENAVNGGAESFAIDPTMANDYGNYGLVGLANGNFVSCWNLYGINYMTVVSPDGSTVVAQQSMPEAESYYSDMIASYSAGAEGFILTEMKKQSPGDMENPYYDMWVHRYNQAGEWQSSAATTEGSLIQPTYTFVAGPTGGYAYLYNYYKSFEVDQFMGFAMPTGDPDIKGQTVDFAMGTLPVTLINYTAKLLPNQKVQLGWSTSSEINCSYFEIEKSNDGTNFRTAGHVTANGNASDYSFIDADAISRNTFYRLKQVDIDGKSKYLGVKLVRTGSKISATVYPNPLQGNTVTLLAGDEPLPLSYRISDTNGRIIKSGVMHQSQEEINVGQLNSGIYFLQIGKEIIKIQR